MYYIPDGTERCGFYECGDCGMRFLDVRTVPPIMCPYCGEEQDMEVGADEETPQAKDAAKLLQILEGEDVEKYDALLSLAETGGDYSWI